MDIRKLAGAGALMLAIAACGSGDEDALMGVGANALTPEQVDAALGPELGNEGSLPANDSEKEVVEQIEAVQAVEEAEPPRPARPQPAEGPETDDETEPPEEDQAPIDNNSSE